MTDGRTDRRTDGRTDGGDCNIPDAFLKKRGDKKCPFFLQRPFYCLGYIGLKKFRVGRQQERTYISFKPNATLYINAPIFGEQCFDVDV